MDQFSVSVCQGTGLTCCHVLQSVTKCLHFTITYYHWFN